MNKPFDLKERTQLFAGEVLKLCSQLPTGSEIGMIRRQLGRAAASVGANYRATQRAKFRKDFVHKLSTVEEEADECLYWLELLKGSKTVSREAIEALHDEASQILAITIASKKNCQEKRALNRI